jgi:hypothetical protein
LRLRQRGRDQIREKEQERTTLPQAILAFRSGTRMEQAALRKSCSLPVISIPGMPIQSRQPGKGAPRAYHHMSYPLASR